MRVRCAFNDDFRQGSYSVSRRETGRIPALVAGMLVCFVVMAADVPDYVAKAAFLHRFAAFVEWPAPAAERSPFTIGVFDSDDILRELTELLPNVDVSGRPAQVRRVRRAHDLEGLHILYLGSSGAASRALLDAAGARPILVVTDTTAGLTGDGVINFMPSQGPVRFEVSLAAAQKHGLKLDSALLAVSSHVEGP
jgi:uncharacterized protein DUF4154